MTRPRAAFAALLALAACAALLLTAGAEAKKKQNKKNRCQVGRPFRASKEGCLLVFWAAENLCQRQRAPDGK